jgi:hypothetical protein
MFIFHLCCSRPLVKLTLLMCVTVWFVFHVFCILGTGSCDQIAYISIYEYVQNFFIRWKMWVEESSKCKQLKFCKE